jgi:serine/threonine protein phosphatase 1
MRTIAIGDIHGCSLALSALLERIRLEPSDRLVFLGDYVDRGPDSRGVLDIILTLRQLCDVVTLLGNHEAMLIDSLSEPQPVPMWVSHCGGGETIASYGGSLQDMPGEHVEFLRGCRRFFETDTHLFVHANYLSHLPLDQQSDVVLLWQHLSMGIPLPHQSGKTAIVGHTPQRTGNILDLGYLKCIDTACFAGGWLTALDVDSGQFWQANREGGTRHCEIVD